MDKMESFQRRVCQSGGNDSLALGMGGVMWRTLQKERRDSVCHTFGNKVSSLKATCVAGTFAS